MLFIDEATLTVKGGKGGRGCSSFRREAYVPRGGPDGGNGGDGGSVCLEADAQLSTLADLVSKPEHAAEDGKPGRGKNQHGRNGEDLVIRVPPGTIVHNAETNDLIRDLTEPGQRVCVAKGGRGGRGNKAFATPTNRAPRQCEEGAPGEERRIELSLKLIADTGLVGFPNAGKSTLLSRVSHARPKVASYPFTTLTPQLGIVDLGDYRSLVMADLPGLIEGAHQGVGLGDQFLRHIERTRVLCHLVDVTDPAGSPAERYCAIRSELEEYSPVLAEKPEIVAANKMDLPEAAAKADELEQSTGKRVFRISAATGMGVRELLRALVREVDRCSCA